MPHSPGILTPVAKQKKVNRRSSHLHPFIRRIYFTVELYSFSFSRKYSSDFMVFPSENLIIYGLPVIIDLEAHSLIKSSAVWTILPAFRSFICKCSTASFPSCSVPFLINFAPFKFSTENIKNSIFFFSILSWALTAPENSARIINAVTNMFFMLSSLHCAMFLTTACSR